MSATLLPSLLEEHLNSLTDRLRQLRAYTSGQHLDFSDGKFTPTVTVTPEEVSKLTAPELECHLMVQNPREWIERVALLHPRRIAFHIESAPNPAVLIEKIVALGARPGLAFNPQTPIKRITKYLNNQVFVVVMGVHPGKQGQPFLRSVLPKIRALTSLYPNLELEVDGGMNPQTIPLVLPLGVRIINVGSYLWQGPLQRQWQACVELLATPR